MKYLDLFESFCKIDKIDKNFLGHKYTKNKKIPHKWDLIKIGKFLSNDDVDVFMVKFKCSECGKEHERHFARWSNLLEIGVPESILKEHKYKTYEPRWDYIGDYREYNSEELDPPIPTTFDENMSLY
jgi:hypothetical protein